MASTEQVELTCTTPIGLSVNAVDWWISRPTDDGENLSDPVQLNTSTDSSLSIDNVTTLVIRNISPDHEGEYSCVAHNSTGGMSAPIPVGCVFVIGELFIPNLKQVYLSESVLRSTLYVGLTSQ